MKTIWNKIEDKLPPENVCVWIHRTSNSVEENPIYFGYRNGKPLSKNPDSSQECHWTGQHCSSAFEEKGYLPCLFSDITVVEWAAINPPQLTP